ncbi:MAG: hypothetical protein KGJ98_07145 [Chloroflexota bacterium]|nr:hypothetical protein [Chloroflexota bacterium]
MKARFRWGPFVPFVVLAVVMVAGGLVNSVDARARVVDDTDSTPVTDIAVYYGSRAVVVDKDAYFTMNDLPRDAHLVAQKPGYGRSILTPGQSELRLVPLTITFEVKDATTGKGVDTPEARQPSDVRVGQGTNSGEMVVGPYPSRDKPVLICAKGYDPQEVTAHGVLMTVTLQPGTSGCPPLPSSAPPVQTIAPSGAPPVPPTPPASAPPTATP